MAMENIQENPNRNIYQNPDQVQVAKGCEVNLNKN